MGKEVRTTSSTGGEKGVKEERYDLIPQGPLAELAAHYGRGASKYDPHQWRQGYEWGKSIAAIGRHQAAFLMGFDYDVCSNDPEGCQHVDKDGEPFSTGRPDTCYNHTGSHHMVAVAWHAFGLLEFKDTHPEHDDRYRPVDNAGVETVEVTPGVGRIVRTMPSAYKCPAWSSSRKKFCSIDFNEAHSVHLFTRDYKEDSNSWTTITSP